MVKGIPTRFGFPGTGIGASNGVDAIDDHVKAFGTRVSQRGKNTVADKAEDAATLAARNAAVANGPSTVDKVMETASGILDIPTKVANPIMMASVGGMAASGVGGLVERNMWAKGGRGISRVGGWLKKPGEFATQSFNEFGELTGTRKPVGGFIQGLADRVAGPIEWIAEKTGLKSWRSGANTKKANAFLKEAQKEAGKVKMDVLHESLHSHFDILHQAANGNAGIEHLASDQVKNALSSIHTIVEEGGEAAKTISADASKLLQAASNASHHQGLASGWKNVAAEVKKVPAAVGKSSAGHKIWDASFVGLSALGMFGTAKGFVEHVGSLKQMYADMTNQDVSNVSTLKVMTGSVPAPVSAARKQLLASVGVESATQLTNMYISIKQLVGGKFNVAKAMGAQMGLAIGGSMAVNLIAGESVLPVYKAFSDASRGGQEIPKEYYAAFIAAASPQFQRLGAENRITLAVAEELAQNKVKAGQLMNMITDGQLVKMGDAAIHKINEARAHPAPVAQQGVSMVDRLNGQKDPKAIVGPNTQKLIAGESEQTLGQNGPRI